MRQAISMRVRRASGSLMVARRCSVLGVRRPGRARGCWTRSRFEGLLHVVDIGGVEIFHGADDGVVIGEVVVGLIVAAETALLLHSLALVLNIVRSDHQAVHAVGFEEEAEIELVLGRTSY
jgi:hypothetical protein